MGKVLITIELKNSTSTKLKELIQKELTIESKILKITGFCPNITIEEIKGEIK